MDGAVRRLTRSYEVRGLLEKVTSYDNAAVGSGNIVNEVQYAYDNFSQPTTEYQSHSGAVNTGTSPKVQYAYANGSANHIRLTSLTYPDARVTTYDYGSANSADDLLSRVFRLKHGSTIMAEYSRLGLNEIVRVDNPPSPGVELTYIKQGAEPDGEAGDKYAGLDRFGRVVDQRWLKTSDGTHRERVKYGYDRANNREWRQNVVAGTGQDEFYTYDGLYQLKTLKRGTLNGNPPATPHTGISGTPSWEEQFNYDPTGNWNGTSTGYKTLATGSTTLDQNRTHNKANEVTDISETVGTAWPTPTQNTVGNVTLMPQPGSLGSSYDAKYDAWNRLVEVKITAGAVQGTYAYDGLNRRVSKTVSGTTRHFYFSNEWQILEERVGASSTADRQFVWGQRYLDDLVLRDKGSERLYVLHDFFHPTAVMVSSTVQERYGYDAFGFSRVMDGSFGSRSSSNYEWETRFGDYRWDSESGLYLVRFRYLHAKLGRWLSRDPSAGPGFRLTNREDFEGEGVHWSCRNCYASPVTDNQAVGQPRAANLYAYIRNASVNGVDPYGLFDPVKDAEKFWKRVAISVIVADLLIIGWICWNLKRGYGGTVRTPGSILATITPIGLSVIQATCNGPGRIELLVRKEQNSEKCHYDYVVVCLCVVA